MARAPSTVLVIALSLGCEPAFAPAPPDMPATAQTSRPPPPKNQAEAQHRAEAGSRYQVGDFVVYRYTGSFTREPVVLRERILEKDGLTLTIDVVAERGNERRQWIQVVTDKPENRKKNVIDALYEVVEGERRRLGNVENRDLFRLYAWTIPPCTHEHRDAGHTDIEMQVAGAKYHCTCKKELLDCSGKSAQLESCECPSFVWLHASGEARALDDSKVIWKATVERFGNAQH